jgi:hypothetical protein
MRYLLIPLVIMVLVIFAALLLGMPADRIGKRPI